MTAAQRAKDWVAAATTGTSTTVRVGSARPIRHRYETSAPLLSRRHRRLRLASSTNLPANNANQTISAWVYFTSVPAGVQTMVGLVKSSATTGSVQLGFRSSLINAWNTTARPWSARPRLRLNAWHHSRTRSTGPPQALHRRRLDAPAQLTRPRPTRPPPPTPRRPPPPVSGPPRPGEYYGGRIDDVRIYNTALTGTDIVALASGCYRAKAARRRSPWERTPPSTERSPSTAAPCDTSTFTWLGPPRTATKVAYVAGRRLAPLVRRPAPSRAD